MQELIAAKIDSIKTRPIDANQYISKPKDFLGTSGIENLENEIVGIIESKSPGDSINSDKVQSFYIGVSPDPAKKPAVNINDTPVVASIMALINGISQSQPDFSINSCLVNYFPCNSSSIRRHSDNEFYIDNKVPIHVITLGDERVVNFSRIYGPNVDELVESITPKAGSIYSMMSGCQDLLWHEVPPDNDISSSNKSHRFSLSFHKIIPYSECSNISEGSDHLNVLPKSIPKKVGKTKKKLFYREQPKSATNADNFIESPDTSDNSVFSDTILILGSSITHELNPDKLVKMRNKTSINCINRSVRGGKMVDMVNEAKDFRIKNPNVNISKVIFQPGTNDIRSARKNGVGHLKPHLFSSVLELKSIFPVATIHIQNLIPIKCIINRDRNNYTARNVIAFNNLIWECCKVNGCQWFDVRDDKFLSVCDSFGNLDINPGLFKDDVHLNHLGIVILARYYKSIINARK